MNTSDSIAVILLVCIGLLGGAFIARKSDEREKVYGGTIGRASHFLASSFIIALAPTVLCSIFFLHPDFLGQVVILGLNITPLAHAVVIALVLILIALALLIPYAIAAKPALEKAAQVEDRGWTEEDARRSGL